MSHPADDTVVPLRAGLDLIAADVVDDRPPPHLWAVPHNIMGGGEISLCPPECPRHPWWAAEAR